MWICNGVQNKRDMAPIVNEQSVSFPATSSNRSTSFNGPRTIDLRDTRNFCQLSVVRFALGAETSSNA